MKVQIKKASRQGVYLKMALMGPTGSGKTYSALGIASGLGSKICVLDTERGSASLYSDVFDFSVVDDLPDYHPQNYIDVMKAVVAAGFEVLVIDSLTHAWNGKGGILEIVDDITAGSKSKNAYTSGWPTGTRLQNDLLDTILTSPIHVIVTMRSKMDYVLQDDGNGKKAPVKVGLAPVQRDGVEYEFTIIGDLNLNHSMAITKTRIQDLDGHIVKTPGKEFGAYLKEWLGSPVVPVVPPSISSAPVPAPQAAPAANPPGAPSALLEKGDEWNAAYAKAKKLTTHFINQKLNGYDNIAKLRADIKAALGVDALQDADLEGVQIWAAHLEHLLANSSTPFEHVPVVQTPDPDPVPAQEIVSADGVLNPEISKLMDELDKEITTVREMTSSLAESFTKSTLDMASKGDIQGMKTLLKSIKTFPKKKAPVDPGVAQAHLIIHSKLDYLVKGDIDGFGDALRMKTALNDFLKTKSVELCTDIDALNRFSSYLDNLIAAGKEVA